MEMEDPVYLAQRKMFAEVTQKLTLSFADCKTKYSRILGKELFTFFKQCVETGLIQLERQKTNGTATGEGK